MLSFCNERARDLWYIMLLWVVQKESDMSWYFISFLNIINFFLNIIFLFVSVKLTIDRSIYRDPSWFCLSVNKTSKVFQMYRAICIGNKHCMYWLYYTSGILLFHRLLLMNKFSLIHLFSNNHLNMRCVAPIVISRELVSYA